MRIIALILASFSFTLNTFAAAPKASADSNPGYYRYMVGDIEVNTISDGTFAMDVSKLLANITPKELDAALKKNFLTKEVNLPGASPGASQAPEELMTSWI